MSGTRRAVFLDRDGVLNELIWNPSTGAYESPLKPEDLILCNDIIQPLKMLTKAGFALFVVSNQPSYAKGKTSLELIKKIAEKFLEELSSRGISIEKDYYCYHHPQGIIPEYTCECQCRKPEPYFLLQAEKDFNIDLKESWMIGDRDSDIECGQRVGTKSILILNTHSTDHQGKGNPDFTAENLSEAVNYIIKGNRN